MGQPRAPKPVKLVMSLILVSGSLLQKVLQDIICLYGDTDFVSLWMDFDFTDYYTREMGRGLKRKILAFQKLICPDKLPSVKLRTNEIEQKYAPNGKRRVNIDPGYVCGEHLILATTKSYAHRPYLRDGIYADLTLIFREGRFRSLEWTYPDYKGAQLREIFDSIRKAYLSQLKGGTGANPSS